MSFGTSHPRAWALSVVLAVAAMFWSVESRAGGHAVYLQPVVPVYTPAPVVAYYPAPVTTLQFVPAVTYQYQLVPVPVSGNGQATAPAAPAPATLNRINVNTRLALIQDQHNEYAKLLAANPGMSLAERTTKLSQSVQKAYATALNVKETELNAAEKKDIDDIVAYNMASTPVTAPAPPATGVYPVAYPYSVVPAYTVPAYTTAPVQLYVPLRPRLSLFHW